MYLMTPKILKFVNLWKTKQKNQIRHFVKIEKIEKHDSFNFNIINFNISKGYSKTKTWQKLVFQQR